MNIDLDDAEREDQRDRHVVLQRLEPGGVQWQRKGLLERVHAQQIADADDERVEAVVLGDHQQQKENSSVNLWLANPQQP